MLNITENNAKLLQSLKKMQLQVCLYFWLFFNIIFQQKKHLVAADG